MGIRQNFWLLFMLVFNQHYGINSIEDEPCCASWVKKGWYELGHENFEEPLPVCTNSVTKAQVKKGQTILINFQPFRNGIIGISACKNEDLNDCYVADIFGLVSGRLGYWWRKHSPDEQGDSRWVPGRNGYQASTVLQSELSISQGTWDQDGKTSYQIYVERTLDDHLEIRLNGGNAEQQKNTSFALPQEYSWMYVESYNNGSLYSVEGAPGCSMLRRFQFLPGQDLRISWLRPYGSFGLSLCSDSGQSECYVLDIFGFFDKKINYWWRRHFPSDGEGNDWVPGKASKTRGIIVKSGQNISPPKGKKAWDTKRLDLFLNRSLDKKLRVHVIGGDPEQEAELVFDVPDNLRYGTTSTVGRVFGLDLSHAFIRSLGPCYNGETLGYLAPTCQHKIPLSSLHALPSKEPFTGLWSPKPGQTVAELRSPILNTGSSRLQVCVALVGLVSEWGASISVFVLAASGNSEGLFVGKLVHNGVNPPEWQHVRLSAVLPESLQNVPLVLKLVAERTAGSLLLLKEAKLCSYDGCGLPTVEGIAHVAYGQKAPLAKYPWHVGIFQSLKGENYKYICGGTLVRSDVVISAAHCFFKNNQQVDKSKFKFAVGKIYNSLYIPEGHEQLSDAKEIFIPDRYKGDIANYVHDIAVISVRFNTSSIILPACMDWSSKKSLPDLKAGDIGEVAGWGKTEKAQQSIELLYANLPYIPYDKCAATVPPTFLRYVTPDKFCAGNVNGQNVQQGDSGGGLVFQTGGLWYIRGVVSTGAPGHQTYTTFTDISQFTTWIKQMLNITEDL